MFFIASWLARPRGQWKLSFFRCCAFFWIFCCETISKRILFLVFYKICLSKGLFWTGPVGRQMAQLLVKFVLLCVFRLSHGRKHTHSPLNPSSWKPENRKNIFRVNWRFLVGPAPREVKVNVLPCCVFVTICCKAISNNHIYIYIYIHIHIYTHVYTFIHTYT